MKPAECRRLAEAHSQTELEKIAEKLSEELDPEVEIHGDDAGEKLTHVLLAARIREKVDAGAELRDAFRDVMASVRTVMSNG